MNLLIPESANSLHAELRTLIASSRQRLAGAVNAELTRLYWSVGERLRTKVLGGADRAKYGDQLIKRVGEQLAQEFGRGFEAKNLRRMVQFAQTFTQPEIVATLSRQLSWSHFVNLLPLKTEQARQFYASQAATNTWSVRELRHQIERKAFERTELAALQTAVPVQDEPVVAQSATPAQVFKDPYFLDFLGLRQGHDEADLESAILRQLEAFILELGRAKRPPSASSSAPNSAANKWSCCKCTKTASPWPNSGLSCRPRRNWNTTCTNPCWKRASGWRGAGCCWKGAGMSELRDSCARRASWRHGGELTQSKTGAQASPALFLKAPYLLDFLDLSNGLTEKDLENAILAELYLKWPAKHEKQPGESSPIAIILCSDKDAEVVELMDLERDQTHVAEYWLQLLPREVLQAKLHKAMGEARARLELRREDSND
ncbi:MAG: hypothetical protein FD135_833 [Comamonadaceae bacterium]|nr:MAG: hypothetical protein FD135_833 [Comamonadaceae bacterium]